MNKVFVVTSDNCSKCENQLSGYMIANSKLYTKWQEGLKEIDFKNAQGAYVCLFRCDDTLKIIRDNMGLVRLYYFSQNGFWAISNSFWELCSVLKNEYHLTLNKGYAEALLSHMMAAQVAFDSLCNEISVLSCFDKVSINCKDREIRIKHDNPFVTTNKLDSSEGMLLIDRWISRWGTIIKGFERGGWNTRVDLSGGYDSRITFAIAKFAKTDFEKDNMQLYSVKPMGKAMSTHFGNDYEIAELVAGDITINSDDKFEYETISAEDRYSEYRENMSDCVNQLFDRDRFYRKPLIMWGGHLGETIRFYGNHYMKKDIAAESIVSDGGFENVILMKNAINAVMKNYQKMNDIYPDADNDGIEIANRYCMEWLDGAFFGKQIQQFNNVNIFCVSPLGDIELRKIRVDEKCNPRVLFAVILARICPELLNISFSSEEDFTNEEKKYALSLCEKYPSNVFIDDSNIIVGEEILQLKDYYNYDKSSRSAVDLMIEEYSKEQIKTLILSKFSKNGKALYDIAKKKAGCEIYHSETYAASLCTIARMIAIEYETLGNKKSMHMDKRNTSEEIEECYQEYLDEVSSIENDSLRIKEYIRIGKENKDKVIYLYGAGKYAIELAEKLLANSVKVQGFIVSSSAKSEKQLIGLNVVDKSDFRYVDEMIIFPAVSFRYYEEVLLEIERIMKKK